MEIVFLFTEIKLFQPGFDDEHESEFAVPKLGGKKYKVLNRKSSPWQPQPRTLESEAGPESRGLESLDNEIEEATEETQEHDPPFVQYQEDNSERYGSFGVELVTQCSEFMLKQTINSTRTIPISSHHSPSIN